MTMDGSGNKKVALEIGITETSSTLQKGLELYVSLTFTPENIEQKEMGHSLASRS